MKVSPVFARYSRLALGAILATEGAREGVNGILHYGENAENTVSRGRTDWLFIIALFALR